LSIGLDGDTAESFALGGSDVTNLHDVAKPTATVIRARARSNTIRA
jgi:hypothetical protein